MAARLAETGNAFGEAKGERRAHVDRRRTRRADGRRTGRGEEGEDARESEPPGWDAGHHLGARSVFVHDDLPVVLGGRCSRGKGGASFVLMKGAISFGLGPQAARNVQILWAAKLHKRTMPVVTTCAGR
jgi:hypothetical protein